MVLEKVRQTFGSNRLNELDEKVKLIHQRVKGLSQHVKEDKDAYNQLKTTITELSLEQVKLHNQLTETAEKVKKSAEQVTKVTTELALFKPRLEKSMTESFQKAIEQELATTTNKINAEAAGFSQAKEIFKKHIEASKDANKAIEKLKIIADSLNEKDFELSKHAKQLELQDKEKLKLMQRIDQLESILAKMKRSQR